MNEKKYFIYTRKSTDTEDKQVRSLADQLAELRELARKEQLEVVDVFIEKQTAKIPGRPVFAEMMERIEAGEASGILAWHPDRLARNSVDGGKVIYLVDTGKITDLKFPTFWFDATPQGKFMLSISFGQSKYYTDNLSENVKRSYRQKLKNGQWPQRAPVGYLNDKKTKSIVIDPEKAPLIKKTFEAYATGSYTISSLRKTIGDLGLKGNKGKELAMSNYEHILKNNIYHGLLYFGGEFYEGKHEPIVSRKLFDTCQEVMKRKSKPQHEGGLKPYVYRGLFKCAECGCCLTTETQKGHNYLRCTKRRGPCSQKYVREEAMTEMIKDELKKVSLPDDIADWLIAKIKEDKTEDDNSSKNQIQKIKDESLAIDVKLDKLMTAYLENALTLEEYQISKNKLITEKQILKDKFEAFGRNSSNRFEPVINFLNDCKQASILAKSSDTEKIRAFFQKVGSNPLVRDRALVFSPRAPFAFVPSIPKTANKNAGGAEGGFQGGIPPRPPFGICISPFSDDFQFSAILLTQWGTNGTGNGQFNHPYGISVDPLGNVYVTDSNNFRVQEFTYSGTYVTQWGTSGSGNLQFGSPYGMAVGPSGNVYVVDSINDRIQEFTPPVFTPSGTYVAQWGASGSGSSQFSGPYGVVVSAAGNVYVIDSGNNRIQEFGSDGTYNTQWGSVGSGNSQFSSPFGTAIDPSTGNIYVADSQNDRIQEFSSSGDFVTEWGSNGSGTKQFVDPNSVAIDSSGNVYVVDTGNNRVEKFSSAGDYVAQWGASGSADGDFNYPYGIAVDSSGNVYVVDSDNFRVQKFDSNGVFLTKWGANGSDNGNFSYPLGISVDSSGNVYVADSSNNRIQEFTSAGVYITQWGTAGSGSGQFNHPYGIAFDPSGSYIYVTDTSNNRVQKFKNFQFISPETYATKWGSTGNNGLGQFTLPQNIAINPSTGNIYVVDTGNNRVQVFSPNDTYIFQWGTAGSGNGQFSSPIGIAIDSSGNVYVADSSNNRIQEFTSAGVYITQWGSTGSGVGQFSHPFGVAIGPSGNIYVTDAVNNRVQEFTPSGATNVTQWGGTGSANGQFNIPLGIAVDPSGDVYVVESGGDRVQEFSSSGEYITKWGSAGSGNSQFTSPFGIAVDSSGNVYVADNGNSRIQGFTSSGQYVFQLGTNGTSNGQFKNPQGITTDASGNVYVADSSNDRIQEFSINNPASLPILSNVDPTSISSTGVTLNAMLTDTGGASPTVEGFYYGISPSYGQTAQAAGSFSVGQFSQTLSDLACATTYYYQAFATNSAGTGTSSAVSFNTSACPPPLSVGSLSESSHTQNSATLSWTFASGGTSPITSQLQRTSNGGSTWTNVSGATVSPATDTGLSSATSYDYRVAYTDSTPTTVYSSILTITTSNASDITAPDITDFSIPSTSSSLLVNISSLVATDAVGVTGYMVNESSTAPGSSDTGWSGTAPASYTFGSAGSKTLYAWAKDAAGNVSTSKSATVVITLPPSNNTLSVTPPTGGTIASLSSDIFCGTTCAMSTTTGTIITLSETPSSGYTFTSWGGACSGTSSTCDLTLDSDKTVSATFTATEVSTDVCPNIDGVQTTVPAGMIISGGDCITPITGGGGGGGGGGGSSYYILTLIKQGTGLGLATSSPFGISCGTNGSSCTYSFFAGSTVVLHALAQSGSHLSSWTGCYLLATSSCSVILNSSKTIDVTFDPGSATTTVINLAPISTSTNIYIPIPGCPTGMVCAPKPLTNLPLTINYQSITLWLILGTTDSQVKTLQEILNANGYAVSFSGTGSVGHESTYFGPATLAALKKFQCATLGVCSGTPTTTGYGATGPKTRAVLNKLAGNTGQTSSNTGIFAAPLTSTPSASATRPMASIIPSSISPTFTFTHQIHVNTSDPDVVYLQMFLNSHGYAVSQSGSGSKGHESKYFGPSTIAALAKFQKANGITPAYGNFGAVTIGKINAMIKSGN